MEPACYAGCGLALRLVTVDVDGAAPGALARDDVARVPEAADEMAAVDLATRRRLTCSAPIRVRGRWPHERWHSASQRPCSLPEPDEPAVVRDSPGLPDGATGDRQGIGCHAHGEQGRDRANRRVERIDEPGRDDRGTRISGLGKRRPAVTERCPAPAAPNPGRLAGCGRPGAGRRRGRPHRHPGLAAGRTLFLACAEPS